MARVTQQQEQTTAARTDQPRAASRSLALQPPPYGIEFADHHAPQARGASSLRVGPAGDASEREAERIATAVTGASRERATADIQRAPDSDAMTAAGGPLTGDLAGRIASARGGSPLPGPLRATMEASIGADFRGVRVHTDAESAQLSRSLGARAFTHGRDIFLGAGRHDPASTSGQRLLAHELTHVVQQGAAPRLGGGGPGVHAPAQTVARCVQRDVGFEFESKDFYTRHGDDVLSDVPFADNIEGQHAFNGKGMRRIAKGGVILERSDIEVQADDNKQNSDLEIVTTHFPETNDGRRRLVAAMGAMANLARRGKDLPTSYAKASDLAGDGFAVRDQGAIILGAWQAATTAPQVTLGIRLRNIPDLVKDLQGDDTESLDERNQRAPGRLMMTAPHPEHPQRPRDFTDLDMASTLLRGARLAHDTIAAYRRDKTNAPGGLEMEGFLTILFSYTEGMQGKKAFLKNNTPLMAKTDLATTWSTLPKDVRAYWGESVWGTSRLEKLVASARGYEQKLDRPFFDVPYDAGITEGDDRVARQWYHKLKLRKVLRGITTGTDYVTTAKFPNLPKGQEIEGYGALGRHMDRLVEPLPVFELRSASRPIKYDQAARWALRMFDYIRSLNQNPGGNYQRIMDKLPPSTL